MRKTLTKKITRTKLKEFLHRHQTTGERVLDIGSSEAGYGNLFPNRVGVDIDESKNPDVVGDAHELPFNDNEFDVILCTEVLEHLHSPHIAAEEMRRVLKPSGKLILTTRFMYPLHDAPHDYFRFTEHGLRHLFKEWEIEELQAETDTMGTFAVLLQTLAQKGSFVGGKFAKAWLLIEAWFIKGLSWIILEERTSGRHGPKMVVDSIMSSGYYLIARNTK